MEEHDEELLELVPHNEGAAPVAVLHTPDSETNEIVLTVAGDEERDVDLAWIAKVVDAAVDGRVRILQGAGRRRMELRMPDGTRHSTEHLGVRGLLPAPGWTRRARITRFQPYSPAKAASPMTRGMSSSAKGQPPGKPPGLCAGLETPDCC